AKHPRRTVEKWNVTDRPYPFTRTFAELFFETAERRPDARAVFDGETELGYRELAERAERIAAALAKKNIGPDALVPMVGPRNIDYLPATVGVLRAGAAYVPVDPNYPAARIRRILEKTASTAILTTPGAELSEAAAGLAKMPKIFSAGRLAMEI